MKYLIVPGFPYLAIIGSQYIGGKLPLYIALGLAALFAFILIYLALTALASAMKRRGMI